MGLILELGIYIYMDGDLLGIVPKSAHDINLCLIGTTGT